MKDEKTERHNKTRMITFIKSKFKKTDDKHVLRQLSNVKNVCKISKIDERTFWSQL